MAAFEFRVFVAGQTPRSRRAVSNLRLLCETRVPGQHVIEVVDVLERPAAAEEERILATPTVLRRAPLPPRRVVGDLSDHRLAANALELPDPPDPEPTGTPT